MYSNVGITRNIISHTAHNYRVSFLFSLVLRKCDDWCQVERRKNDENLKKLQIYESIRPTASSKFALVTVFCDRIRFYSSVMLHQQFGTCTNTHTHQNRAKKLKNSFSVSKYSYVEEPVARLPLFFTIFLFVSLKATAAVTFPRVKKDSKLVIWSHSYQSKYVGTHESTRSQKKISENTILFFSLLLDY